jgi:hypothetical protein
MIWRDTGESEKQGPSSDADGWQAGEATIAVQWHWEPHRM